MENYSIQLFLRLSPHYEQNLLNNVKNSTHSLPRTKIDAKRCIMHERPIVNLQRTLQRDIKTPMVDEIQTLRAKPEVLRAQTSE